MAASAISCLIQVLRPLIQNEVGLLWGVDKEMKRLSSTLSTILAVLDDAELKQLQQRPIQDWLCKLKDAAYEIRDILEDFKTEASRWESEGQSCGSVKKVWTCYPVQKLFFRHNIGNRMKDIIEEIDSIAQERTQFHLKERVPENLNEYYKKRETISALPQLQVVGREDDKNHILKVLTVDICDVQQVSVYPIIGMGGLGKTTLAQMVVNSGKIKSHFEPIVWVYVSPYFSVQRVMKRIIESVSKEILGDSSLEFFQQKFRQMLSGKRYLLVLDDVWNEDQLEWDNLMSALSNGSSGACILVTTRSEKVASSIPRRLPTHELQRLCEDDCWLLFKQRAFVPDKKECADLVAIGKEIVKKCGGVPLAAKVLGGLLRSKTGVKQWENIKESNLWDLSEGEVSILSALRLSYYDLPIEMRHCFTYCAVFPKGSRMKKENVIQLWMANGFISCSSNLEVVGEDVWNELYLRSLFLRDEENPEDMCMHDLVHDLARSIIEDEYYTMEAKTSSTISKQKIRHVTLVSNGKLASAFPKALKGQGKLHSILLQHRGQLIIHERNFSCDFKNMGSLRVFDGSGAKMMQLSKSIGNSKHLTYLNLSETPITELPASICSLPHLQTLNLNGCEKLRRLPKKMHYLTGLRHLFLQRCYKIEDTPPKLGKLNKLKTLSLFVVGESDGQRLGELQHLDLGGELRIRNLERVRNSKEAEEVNLAGKHNLNALSLEWSELQESIVEREVIEALQPLPNIKELTIRYYRGAELPSWISDPSVLSNVVSIRVIGCINCLELPALWHLRCLKFLHIGMCKMEYMFPNGNNFTGGVTSAKEFSSLEKLWICGLKNLKGLLSVEEEVGGIVQQQQLLFPRLRKMQISDCPQLALLPTLPALEKLRILCNTTVTLLASISKLTTLTSLELAFNEDMVSFPDEMLQNQNAEEEEGGGIVQQQQLLFPRLRKMTIQDCPRVVALPKLAALEKLEIQSSSSVPLLASISKLTSLTSLKLDSNEDIVYFPDEMLQNLTLLQYLRIDSFEALKVLPENMSSLVSLKKLEIACCEELECLPYCIQILTQLQVLNICGSPELGRRCEKGKGQDWYKIKHIQQVEIYQTR